MLCLKGLLEENYVKVRVTGRQWESRLKSPEITQVQFCFLVELGSTVPGSWECCSASADSGSVPALAQIISQLAWIVTAHKYKAVSLGRRFPGQLFWLSTLNLPVLGGDKCSKIHGCMTLTSSCQAAVCSVKGC